MPRTMMAPRRWNLGMSFDVPARMREVERAWARQGETHRRTVDLPELGNDLVVDDALGHHDGEQLLERGELGKSGVASEPARCERRCESQSTH
jgi:hypothetical protein